MFKSVNGMSLSIRWWFIHYQLFLHDHKKMIKIFFVQRNSFLFLTLFSFYFFILFIFDNLYSNSLLKIWKTAHFSIKHFICWYFVSFLIETLIFSVIGHCTLYRDIPQCETNNNSYFTLRVNYAYILSVFVNRHFLEFNDVIYH